MLLLQSFVGRYFLLCACKWHSSLLWIHLKWHCNVFRDDGHLRAFIALFCPSGMLLGYFLDGMWDFGVKKESFRGDTTGLWHERALLIHLLNIVRVKLPLVVKFALKEFFLIEVMISLLLLIHI